MNTPPPARACLRLLGVLLLLAAPLLGACANGPQGESLETAALHGGSPAALEQARPVIASLPHNIFTTEKAETAATGLRSAQLLDPEARLVVQAVVAARLCPDDATIDHQINWFAEHNHALHNELTLACGQTESQTPLPRIAALQTRTHIRMLALLDNREQLYQLAQCAARSTQLRDQVRSDSWALRTLLWIADRRGDGQTVAALDWPEPSPVPGQILSAIPMAPLAVVSLPFALAWTIAGGNGVH